MYAHPSALIRAEAEDNASKHREAGRAWSEIAARLEEYEAEQGVRFIALPVEALERLRTAWEVYSDQGLVDRLVEMTRDLFDGSDGHLHTIDAVLPREVKT